ncbi:MAG: MATE family efflux transporter [Calditrichia bacterium]
MSAPTKRSSLGDVLRTSLPAAIDLSSQTIAWLIEAIFIGMISAAAFAGVGISLQIILLTFTVILTFVVGASVIILNYLGANDEWGANHVFAQALIIGTILSFLISIFWYFGGSQLMLLIGEDEPAAREYGIQYLKTVSWCGPLIILNFIALGIMRMAGDTLTTMKINLFANGLHITLSPIFIFGWGFIPRMEATGAAIAVSIAHSLAFFITLYHLRSRNNILFLSLREFTKPNMETVKKLFRLGMPTTVEQLVWAVGQLVLSFYAGQISILVLATHTAYVRIQSVLTMAFQGFGLASMSLVGKSLGAQDDQKAIDAGATAQNVALGFSIAFAVLLVVFKRPLLEIFTTEAEVIALGISSMLIVAIIQIPKGINAVLSGNLRGSGDLKWLMYISLFSVVLFELIGGYYSSFVFHFSLAGLWALQGADETLRMVLNYWRFKRGKWKIRDLLGDKIPFRNPLKDKGQDSE